MTIYPTFLYIKQHSITGLKYFGKTSGKDPYTYNGSGKHWVRHIKAHGTEHIQTLWVSEPFIDSELISEFALAFSKEHNIVESKGWANLIEENGLDGCPKGKIISEDTKAKLSAAKIGKTHSDETKAKMTGRFHSAETKAKMSASRVGKTPSEETKRKSSASNVGKSRSDETKANISTAKKGKSNSNKGRTLSEEHKSRISDAKKLYHLNLKIAKQLLDL